MSGHRWAAALPLLERWVEEAERMSGGDDWAHVPQCPAPLIDEPVPAELAGRARAVAARMQRLESRLLTLREDSRAALAELDARRRAARQYARSHAGGSTGDRSV